MYGELGVGFRASGLRVLGSGFRWLFMVGTLL